MTRIRYRRKLVVVGDGACGKTSLLVAFSEGTFPGTFLPKVLGGCVTDVVVDGRLVEFAIWDTASEEEYDRLRPLSYPDSHIVLICFALDSPKSLDNVKYKWRSEVLQYCPGLPLLLVGCKKDLRETSHKFVTRDEGMAVAQKIGAMYYLECSAKFADGVREVFECAGMATLHSSTAEVGLWKNCCIVL